MDSINVIYNWLCQRVHLQPFFFCKQVEKSPSCVSEALKKPVGLRRGKTNVWKWKFWNSEVVLEGVWVLPVVNPESCWPHRKEALITELNDLTIGYTANIIIISMGFTYATVLKYPTPFPKRRFWLTMFVNSNQRNLKVCGTSRLLKKELECILHLEGRKKK